MVRFALNPQTVSILWANNELSPFAACMCDVWHDIRRCTRHSGRVLCQTAAPPKWIRWNKSGRSTVDDVHVEYAMPFLWSNFQHKCTFPTSLTLSHSLSFNPLFFFYSPHRDLGKFQLTVDYISLQLLEYIHLVRIFSLGARATRIDILGFSDFAPENEQFV